jgi:hypothetical protein
MIRLRVSTSRRGKIVAVAKARVGKGRGQMKVAGRARKTMAGPGRTVLRIRLSKAARHKLRMRRPLRVSVRVSQTGTARGQAMSFVLKRVAR